MHENHLGLTTLGVRLGQSHGYRIEHDTAMLNADLDIPGLGAFDQRSWALQLWACESPYTGGLLSGIKVAETAVALPSDQGALCQRFDATTAACLPPGQRAYSMVLVLACSEYGGPAQVHDFANYPARERFAAPALDGTVGYAIEGESVVLHVSRIHNERPSDNLSGSLVLELRARREPAAGVGPEDGVLLAQAELGRLAGQQRFEQVERRAAFAAPSGGAWRLSLALREWTASGYVTRDYRDFDQLLHQPEVERAEQAARVAAPEASSLEPAREPVAEPTQAESAPLSAEAAPSAAAPTAAEPPKAPKAGNTASAKRASNEEADSQARRRLSVQKASVEELAQVKGLNKKLATEIVKARPFASLDDLLKVRGIGAKMLEKLRAELTL